MTKTRPRDTSDSLYNTLLEHLFHLYQVRYVHLIPFANGTYNFTGEQTLAGKSDYYSNKTDIGSRVCGDYILIFRDWER